MAQSAPSTEPVPATLPAGFPATFIAQRQANGWTIKRLRAFRGALTECGYVDRAAAVIGMARQGAYYFKNSAAAQAFFARLGCGIVARLMQQCPARPCVHV
jgi:hypothetical protein